jgi:predicted dehydrogenase
LLMIGKRDLHRERRRFLTGSAGGLAVGSLVGHDAWTRLAGLACETRADENDRESVLRLAAVGVGGMGAADLNSLASHPRLKVVALCDVDSGNLAAAAKRYPGALLFADWREMLKELGDECDAISVSTPDHTHAPVSVEAMRRGKHVYCQKPLTHSVHEARQLRLEADKAGVVTQMGTQIHSATEYRTAARLIQQGAIGPVSAVHSWSDKSWAYEGPDPVPGEPPTNLDWDLWLGTAPYRPYAAGHYHPANWRRWSDFGCGTMGDMAIHILDPVFTALKLASPLQVRSQSPVAAAATFGLKNRVSYSFPGTEYTTDSVTLDWYDGGLRPDTTDWPLAAGQGLPGQGSMFIGTKGYLLLPHVGMPQLLPAKSFANYVIEPAAGGDHYHLWVDACLGGPATTAGFDYAGPLTESVLLGVLANRFPHIDLQWDAEQLQITNHEVANGGIQRPYRAGWEIVGLG